MGFSNIFNLLGCLEVTLILRDFKTVTGKIVKISGDERKKWGGHHKHDCCHKHEEECEEDKEHKKHEEECCKPIKVEVEEKEEFILLELTRDAESVSLQEVELETGEFEIEWVNVEFRRGSCIVVNVADIIYAGVNADIDEERIEFGLAVGTTSATTATPTTKA